MNLNADILGTIGVYLTCTFFFINFDKILKIEKKQNKNKENEKKGRKRPLYVQFNTECKNNWI